MRLEPGRLHWIKRLFPHRACAAALLLATPLLAGSGNGEESSTYPVDHARFFPVGPGVLWREVLALTDELGLDRKVFDPKNGILVTKPQTWPPKLKEFRRLEHPPGYVIREFELHILVPRHLYPGRIYVNSRMRSGSTNVRIVFNDGRLESWLMDRIAERLGVTAHPIPYDPEKREALSRELAGDRVSACPITKPISADEARASLELIQASKVLPDYPERAGRLRQTGIIMIDTLIDEAGVPSRVVATSNTTDDPEFLISAENTIRFWRFRPAIRDGCPVPTDWRISVGFRMR